MGILLILLGLHQVVSSRPAPSPRALFLGTGLVLVGCLQLLEEASPLHRVLTWVAWPVLVVALVLSYRDGTLAQAFPLRRRRADPGHGER